MRTATAPRHSTRRLGPVAAPPFADLAPAPYPAEAVHPVEEHLCRYLRRRWSVRDGDAVVVGWSGSPGSTALLCALAACAAETGPRVRVTAVWIRPSRPGPADRRVEESGRALAARLGVPLRVVDAPASSGREVPGEVVNAALREVAEELSAPVALLGRTREERVLEILHRVLDEGALEELSDPVPRNGSAAPAARPLAAPFVELDGAPVRRYASERAPEVGISPRSPAEDPAHPHSRLHDRILPAILEEYPYADTCILRLEELARQAHRLLARSS